MPSQGIIDFTEERARYAEFVGREDVLAEIDGLSIDPNPCTDRAGVVANVPLVMGYASRGAFTPGA